MTREADIADIIRKQVPVSARQVFAGRVVGADPDTNMLTVAMGDGSRRVNTHDVRNATGRAVPVNASAVVAAVDGALLAIAASGGAGEASDVGSDPLADAVIGQALRRGPDGATPGERIVVADWYSDPRQAVTAAGSGGTVRFSEHVTYPFIGPPTLLDGMHLIGGDRATTILDKQFDGDFATVMGGVVLRDLTLEGNGASMSGRGLTFPNGEGAQDVENVAIIDFDGPCVYFDTAGGSLSHWRNVEVWRTNGSVGSGNYAVVVDPVLNVEANPRTFIGLRSVGNETIDLGGCNNLFIVASRLDGVLFRSSTRAALIAASRITGTSPMVLDGWNSAIVGCDIFPTIEIAAGAGSNAIGPNSYNNIPVIDNSGRADNEVIHRTVAYTPELTSGGTAPSLGNGTLTGEYSRAGTAITVTVELVIGSTTTLGTGDLRISLPVPRVGGNVQYTGQAVIALGSDLTMAPVEIAGALGYFRVRLPGTAGYWTSAVPGAMTTGQTVRISFTYTI